MTTVRGAERGAAWEAPLADVLAEPVPGHPQWITAVARRLVVAQAAPALVGLGPDAAAGRAARCAAAGWPLVAPGADADQVRAAAWELAGPLLGLGGVAGVGSLRPALVVVGEAVTRAHQVPFHARSGTRLWAALRLLGWDELQVRVTNALGADRKAYAPAEWRELARVLAPLRPVYLTLGKVAHQALTRAKIKHVNAQHPAWHQRFKAGEGFEGLAQRLEDAGVPRGPCAPRLPALTADPAPPGVVRVAGDLPPLPGAPGALAGGVGYRKQPAAPSPGIAPEVLIQARNLFLVGEVRTISELASKLALDANKLAEVARAEGWREQRVARTRRVAAEALERADEAEALRLAEARRVAWDCVTAGLEDVRERIFAARGHEAALGRLAAKREAGDQDARPLHPTCAGAKALAQAAVLLRGERQVTGPARSTLQDLVRQVLPILEEAGGGEP